MSTWTRWNCNGSSQISEAVKLLSESLWGAAAFLFLSHSLWPPLPLHLLHLRSCRHLENISPSSGLVKHNLWAFFFHSFYFFQFSHVLLSDRLMSRWSISEPMWPQDTLFTETPHHTHSYTLMSQVVKLCLCLNLSLSQAFTKLLWFYWVSSKSFFFFFHTQNTLNDLTVLTCQKCNCKMCGEIYMSWFTSWRCAYFLSSTLFSSLWASVPEQSQSVFTLVSLYDLPPPPFRILGDCFMALGYIWTQMGQLLRLSWV